MDNKDFTYSISLQCPECNEDTKTISVDHKMPSEIKIISLCEECNIKWKTTIKIERVGLIDETINRINKFRS